MYCRNYNTSIMNNLLHVIETNSNIESKKACGDFIQIHTENLPYIIPHKQM